MSQQSEERLPESAPATATPSAQILPFERPQNDLQRAIQIRAQEAIDRDSERDRETRRPRPLKWLIIFAIAAIPVVLTFGAVDGFLRAFYKVNETYQSMPVPEPAQPATEQPVLQSSEPGVVLLQPVQEPEAQPKVSTPAK